MSPAARRVLVLLCCALVAWCVGVPAAPAWTVGKGPVRVAVAKAKKQRKAAKRRRVVKHRRVVKRRAPARRVVPVVPVAARPSGADAASAVAAQIEAGEATAPVLPAAPEAPTGPAAAAGGPWPAAVPEGFFGINLGLDVVAQPDAQLHAHMRAIAAAGIDEVRTDASWAAVETTAPSGGAHHYDWASTDRVAAAIGQAGLRWYPTLGYSPPWATSDPAATYPYNQPPAAGRVDDFAAYVAAFATRYGRGGAFWAAHPELHAPPVTSYELWNEPNLRDDFGWTPATLATVYAAAAPRVHAVDPHARVIPGALDATAAGTPRDAERYAEALPHADALAIHLYVFSLDYLEGRLAAVRHALPATVPLDVNEVSWTVSGDGGWPVSPATRDANFRAIASRWGRSNCNVARLMPFAYATTTTPMTDAQLAADPDPYPGYGLWRSDGTPTSGAKAYTSEIAHQTGLAATAPDRTPLPLC